MRSGAEWRAYGVGNGWSYAFARLDAELHLQAANRNLRGVLESLTLGGRSYELRPYQAEAMRQLQEMEAGTIDRVTLARPREQEVTRYLYEQFSRLFGEGSENIGPALELVNRTLATAPPMVDVRQTLEEWMQSERDYAGNGWSYAVGVLRGYRLRPEQQQAVETIRERRRVIMHGAQLGRSQQLADMVRSEAHYDLENVSANSMHISMVVPVTVHLSTPTVHREAWGSDTSLIDDGHLDLWGEMHGITRHTDEQDAELRWRILEQISMTDAHVRDRIDGNGLPAPVSYMLAAVDKISDETFALWLRAWGMPKGSTREDLRTRIPKIGAGDVCAPHLAEQLSIAIKGDVRGTPIVERTLARVAPCEIECGEGYFGPTEDEIWLRDLLGDLNE